MRLSVISTTIFFLGWALTWSPLRSHAADATASPGDAAGFMVLFDGKDLDHWTYSNKRIGQGYQVDPEEKVLYCTRTDGGNLLTKKEYGDFILRFEFKLEAGANNGIGIRSPYGGNPAFEGMEIQILDDTADKYAGKLRPEQYHGSIYDLFAPKPGSLKPVGEWNEEEIIADGRHITIKVNGQTIVEANLDDVTDQAKIDKHPGIKREKGHIVLMGHGSRVDFRNIRIKELP